MSFISNRRFSIQIHNTTLSHSQMELYIKASEKAPRYLDLSYLLSTSSLFDIHFLSTPRSTPPLYGVPHIYTSFSPSTDHLFHITYFNLITVYLKSATTEPLFSTNYLFLNDTKTNFRIFYESSNSSSVLTSVQINSSSSLTSLSLHLDSFLSISDLISFASISANVHLFNISNLETNLHSLSLCSLMSYCSTLFHSFPLRQLNKIETCVQ